MYACACACLSAAAAKGIAVVGPSAKSPNSSPTHSPASPTASFSARISADPGPMSSSLSADCEAAQSKPRQNILNRLYISTAVLLFGLVFCFALSAFLYFKHRTLAPRHKAAGDQPPSPDIVLAAIAGLTHTSDCFILVPRPTIPADMVAVRQLVRLGVHRCANEACAARNFIMHHKVVTFGNLL